MKIKLLPCPFCGGSAKSFSSFVDGWVNGISCKCGVEVHFFNKEGVNVAVVKPSNREDEHNEMAREWNRRSKAKRAKRGWKK